MNQVRPETSPSEHAAATDYDVTAVRAEFPQLARTIHGRRLVYLDSAATAQRPRAVLDAMQDYHTHCNANVHRGLYTLSEEATVKYEAVRDTLARFTGIDDSRRVVFGRGCTEAINLVAHSFLAPRLQPGDEILVTEMEHHSNIVPWQLVAEQKGAKVVAAPIDDRGELILEEVERRLNERTRLLAFNHVSNALGTINPVASLVELAHSYGVPVLVDGAQGGPHAPIEVDAWGADFYTVSGHKVYGPTGVGALIGKWEHLESMPPWHGGGDMIRRVSFEGTTFADPPQRFEAGTPPIAAVIGLGAAVEFVESIGHDALGEHERDVLEYGTRRLLEIDGVRLFGEAREKSPVLSFVLEGIHAQDVATLLDEEGIAVRAGHHCTQPLWDHFGVPATVRASFGCYSDHDDVDRLVEALQKVRKIFAV